MQQTQLSLLRERRGASRPLLQPLARCEWKDPVPLVEYGRGRHCAAASRARTGIPEEHRSLLGGLRTLGRCGVGNIGSGPNRGREKKGFKTAFEAEIFSEIEKLIGPGTVASCDLEAVETAARRKALEVAARVIEQRFNADTADYAGPVLPCTCGQQARYVDRRSKTFQTVLGDLNLERAYYHCGSCEKGFYPRDRALGLEGSSLSPAVLRMVGQVGAVVSFEEGHELLHELAALDVSAKQIERYAEGLGREIADDEQNLVESELPSAPTMYLGIDGTGVPVRKQELAARPGKQPDGSAKTREVKLVTVWSAETRDEQGQPMRDPGSITYSAAIESAATLDTDSDPAEFVARVIREARRRGFDQASRRVVLGDGALWIWNLADEHFPDATQIVDLYHAKGHLWDVGKAIYGAGSDLAERWAKQRRDELDDGKLDDILAALALHVKTNEEARRCFDYVTRNCHRMRYPEFRAQGLCVGSGVVEAGCKTAIGVRCKRAGMHWTVAGADAIIALRCCKLSGRFEDFWERRAVATHR